VGRVPAAEPVVVEFDESRRAPVVRRMARMGDARAGWINLSPGLDVEEPPPSRSVLGALFSARGPTVPLATWAPAQGREPATIGVEHGQGPRVVRTLAGKDAAVPPGWRVTQDHPRRGLVVVPQPAVTDQELDAVLAWLLRAAGALCPVPRSGQWRAYCYEV
jgi:hypothetical protein